MRSKRTEISNSECGTFNETFCYNRATLEVFFKCITKAIHISKLELSRPQLGAEQITPREYIQVCNSDLSVKEESKLYKALADVKKSVKWILFNTRDARYCRKPKTRLQGLQDDRHSEVKPSPFVKNVETEDERDDPEFGDTD